MPEVSIVMTVYNGEDYVKEAIDSVLRQTFTGWELIVVNDGSTDSTLQILETYNDARIKILNQKNTGLGVAANNGIGQAQGRWVARIDDDDIWESLKLEKQMQFLKANSDHILIGCYATAINHRGEELYLMELKRSHQEIASVILEYNPFIHSSVIFRKDIFDEIGGYYEPMNKYMIDYLLFYQFSKLGKVANLQEPLVQYRISTSSIGHSFGSEDPEVTELIRKGVHKEGLEKQEREKLRELKRNQFSNPRERKGQYYFFSGRALLFYALRRGPAIRDLLHSLGYNFFKLKTWGYLAVAIFAPKPVIDKLHNKFLSSHVKSV